MTKFGDRDPADLFVRPVVTNDVGLRLKRLIRNQNVTDEDRRQLEVFLESLMAQFEAAAQDQLARDELETLWRAGYSPRIAPWLNAFYDDGWDHPKRDEQEAGKHTMSLSASIDALLR